MQDKKLLNFGGATVGEKGVYSIEFHEDNEFTHVKRANRDGTATYFSLAGGGGTSKTFEYWENTLNAPRSVSANIIEPLVNDGLGINTSSNAGTLYNGSLFDFSSLAIGSVVSITLQIALQPTTQHSHDFTIWFNHETDSGTKQFSLVTDETRTQGRPITHTITLPIIDAGMQGGSAGLWILSLGDLTVFNNFVSISVL